MREILFRGQQVDNGEWVIGNLVKINNWSMHRDYEKSSSYINTDCEEVDILTFLKGSKLFAQTMLVQVKDKTVCQFTGLLDKNGTRVFSGDILDLHSTVNGVNLFEVYYDEARLGWSVKYYTDRMQHRPLEYEYSVTDFFSCCSISGEVNYEVVGTIHDK